jgi:3-deoxy-manno-octulosonate cytidylyltransferase (CMP-KDO synthetase)
MKVLGIIPARFASTRFPGKPLIDIGGKSMIRRVYEQALKCEGLEEVVVATDDERIKEHAVTFGAKVVMTSTKHPSGTDRCQEVVEKLDLAYDFIVNIQGDEPFVNPRQLDQLISILNPDEVQLATLAKRINDPGRLIDPNSVKVVFDNDYNAIYFSRHPIPFNRDETEIENWLAHTDYFKHIGIYAYRTDILKAVTKLSRSRLEISESLEQLRWLENGYKIKVGITELESPNIDSPEDLEKIDLQRFL